MPGHGLVLFDTSLGTTNLGDDIIFQCVLNEMSNIINQYSTIRLATHVDNFNPFQIRKGQKIEFIKNADLKLICGTNLLMDDLHLKRAPQFRLYKWNKVLYERAVLVGVGSTNYKPINQYTRKLYQSTFSHDHIHSVRDEWTRESMESMGFHAVNTGCPTMWGITEEKSAAIPHQKSDRVVFSLSGYNSQLNRENDAKMMDILFEQYSELYAWIQTTRDEQYIDSILHGRQVHKIRSLAVYDSFLNQNDVDYVGTRLHGGVYALLHGKRTIVVAIDNRARGFHKTHQLPIVERENIEELQEMIPSVFSTNIINPRKEIDTFLGQFETVDL